MTRQKTYRVIAVVCYLFIMLMGQMIALPFFFWLAFTLFDFGNIDQLFALLATIGLVTIGINHNEARTSKMLTLDVICFFLLASPLVWRMTEVPIELFNYLAFIIPTALFAMFYTASLFFGCREYSRIKESSS